MKNLKFIFLFSLMAIINGCSESEPGAFHFGPGPRAEEEVVGEL